MLPNVTSDMEIFLYLPVHIVFDLIASYIVAIKRKFMLIFDKNSLTVLDQTTSFLSLHIYLAVLDQTTSFIFLFMFHSLQRSVGYWTKLTCVNLLPLTSNLLEWSDLVIVKLALSALSPPNDPPTNAATIPTRNSMVTYQMNCFFYLISLRFMACWYSATIISASLIHPPCTLSLWIDQYLWLLLLFDIYVLGLHQLWWVLF